MKIFFGGTFDPVHCGHIKLALQVNDEFKYKVNLLPLGGIPNYKSLPEAALADRLAMLKLVKNKYPHQIDIDYTEAANPAYSPTYYTLKHLRSVYGFDLPIYFIIGGDSLISLDTWDNWLELFSLTNFIVAMRPDYPLQKMSKSLTEMVMPRLQSKLKTAQPYGQIIVIDFAPLLISSTKIRQLCKDGKNLDNLVTPEVANYIYTHSLYKAGKGTGAD